MNALTGWIPDKIDLRDGKCDPSRTFKALQEKHAQGMVLITVATGNLPEHAATRAGLVPNHAYALLDLREAEVLLLYTLGYFCCKFYHFYKTMMIDRADNCCFSKIRGDTCAGKATTRNVTRSIGRTS